MSSSAALSPAIFAWLEAINDGWVKAMNVEFTSASPQEVVAELSVGPQHKQPLGLVHGGVYAGIIETVASVGASIHVFDRGCFAVGLENHTSFLHATREGHLRAVGRPLQTGRQSHVWEVNVYDDSSRIAATGRVRLMIIESGRSLAGRSAALEPSADPSSSSQNT
ncbi:MAG: PaaI family thioesterase [Myxococcota bacterium]